MDQQNIINDIFDELFFSDAKAKSTNPPRSASMNSSMFSSFKRNHNRRQEEKAHEKNLKEARDEFERDYKELKQAERDNRNINRSIANINKKISRSNFREEVAYRDGEIDSLPVVKRAYESKEIRKNLEWLGDEVFRFTECECKEAYFRSKATRLEMEPGRFKTLKNNVEWVFRGKKAMRNNIRDMATEAAERGELNSDFVSNTRSYLVTAPNVKEDAEERSSRHR